MTADFRAYVPPPGHPRYEHLGLDIRSYSDKMLQIPKLVPIFAEWIANIEAPFVGVTADGNVLPGLFSMADEDAPVEAMTNAANAMLSLTTPAERDVVCLPLDSGARRRWSNPEIFAFRHGLRLDEIGPKLRQAILEVVRASLSDYGFLKARDCMIMNEFLGEVVGAPQILNRFSYNFTLFGAPSVIEPWGWQLHGHHLAMNVLAYRSQMVMTPCFWGAEPNVVDAGPHQGLKLFQDEELRGLAFMQSLPAKIQARARLYPDVNSPLIPPGRKHPADHLHLAGAGRDNRVIPYEGVPARDFDSATRTKLLDLIEVYHRHLPDGVKRARMNDVERHFSDCHFCWIGGTGPDDPFYYRIQSPVTVIEFDHHAGIFLINETAKKFHIHTLMRTPNGNDFGMAIVRQYCEARQRRAVADAT